ncbi:SWITCH/sucrose nonfermenting 3A [Actinidia rufa]|uniref:SWITCH/sucrose nonfermenting 3A n=1 Tax=Actinidia rufa TaxID=165716 RepID=A0A7J0FYY7_9ERIC|nr:SWITCH/sucrose nonfermenting 3A [Actinidia rufa]
METPSKDPSFKTPASRRRWFSWDDIHDTEKSHLREFFDGSSFTRSPKIYRDYRDFIISKFREDPSRRLTFTEVRKSLVGDISVLHKVFAFLERCGLINFCAPGGEDPGEEGNWRVRVEDGAPNGVRVVAAPNPNSLKPVTVPPGGSDNGRGVVGNGFDLPPLASYRDVYSERKGTICGNCKQRCESGHYECTKCFKNGHYGENKSVDDFKFIDCIPNSGNHEAVWTEAETLLLLESVLKHGDNWDLVAENVKTKTKADCISKLIELPFGDLMLGSTHRRGRLWDNDGNMSIVQQVQLPSSETHSQENIKTDDQCHDVEKESNQNGDAETQVPPLKRKRTISPSDTGNALMKQSHITLGQPPPLSPAAALLSPKYCSSHLSSMVGPHITASAAEAAVTALCDECQCPREIFDGDANEGEELGSSPQNNKKEREIEERPTELESQGTSSEKNAIPLTFRIRAATATALGAASARAKLLADQEDREIECLAATIIETQLKKLQCKIKHIDDMELIMEKEYTQLEELKESIIAEQMNALQRVFSTGISRWKDHTSVKPHVDSVL